MSNLSPYSLTTNEIEQFIICSNTESITSNELRTRLELAKNWDSPIYSMSFFFARFLERLESRELKLSYIDKYYKFSEDAYFLIEELDSKFIHTLFSFYVDFHDYNLEDELLEIHKTMINHDY